MTTACERLTIERYIGGELSSDEVEKLKQHCTTCPDCASHMQQLETGRVAFLQKHPFASFTRAHAPIQQLHWFQRVMQTALRPVYIPLYGLVLVVLVAIPYLYQNNNTITFKGGSTVTYIYERDGATFERTSNDRFRGGDKVQVLYSSTKKQYLSLVSIDMSGKLSFYQPDSKSSICSIPVNPGTSVPYPASIELDAAPGSELVCALFSEAPLSTDDVSKWVAAAQVSDDFTNAEKRLAAGSVSRNAELSVVLLKKE